MTMMTHGGTGARGVTETDSDTVAPGGDEIAVIDFPEGGVKHVKMLLTRLELL
jgi:hypothetical protein